jgi:hypothetical protein
MPTTRMERDKLLEILEANRAKHRKVFEAAFAGFQKESRKVLNSNLRLARAGKLRKLYVSLPAPTDHTRDYDTIIRMVKMNTESTFVLDERTFTQYVEDNWNWKQEWLANSSSYAKETTVSVYAAEFADA